jgi:hypothetical protein
MRHTCQWPLDEGYCEKPAHHILALDEGSSCWLCSHHFDRVNEFWSALSKCTVHDDVRRYLDDLIRQNKM